MSIQYQTLPAKGQVIIDGKTQVGESIQTNAESFALRLAHWVQSQRAE